jgi:hypothetical protein
LNAFWIPYQGFGRVYRVYSESVFLFLAFLLGISQLIGGGSWAHIGSRSGKRVGHFRWKGSENGTSFLRFGLCTYRPQRYPASSEDWKAALASRGVSHLVEFCRMLLGLWSLRGRALLATSLCSLGAAQTCPHIWSGHWKLWRARRRHSISLGGEFPNMSIGEHGPTGSGQMIFAIFLYMTFTMSSI